MQPIAPGTVVFHRFRGYGVLTAVNLLSGWVSVRFGQEAHTLDLCLSCDELQHADREPILFRRQPPERMPHARLMAMVRALHGAGYQRLYLYSWPKPSGLHWHWHLFAGLRSWSARPLRAGWFGSGADYIFNPVLGWDDAPGASTAELIQALAKFDPEGLSHAIGRDAEHSDWFAATCDALLPDYAYSFGWEAPNVAAAAGLAGAALQVMPVRQRLPAYSGVALPLPPGLQHLERAHRMLLRSREVEYLLRGA
ncbi:MAG: L-asparaginase [Oxalobacteraceae bacterium]